MKGQMAASGGGMFIKQSTQRKYWLFAAICACVSLFFMLLYYIHWQPKTEVAIYLEPLAERHMEAQGNGFQVNYIMADDAFVALKPFAEQDWVYDGTLQTYTHAAPLSFTVEANRIVELSMKKGPWMGKGIVHVGGDKRTIDFYSTDDGSQYLVRLPLHQFLNSRTLLIGTFCFGMLFIFLLWYTRKFKFSAFWSSPIEVTDFISVSAILILSVLFCMDHTDGLEAKGIYYGMDVAMYVAGGKKILRGFVPYLQHYEEKGPVMLLLCALGELIWFPYGIWILYTGMFIVGAAFLYLAMRQLFSKYISLMSVVFTVLLCKAYNAGGVNTEIMSVPFICASLYVFIRYFKTQSIRSHWLVLCGLCFAATLFMRVSNAWLWVAGVPVSIYFPIYKKNFRDAAKKLSLMALGAGIVIIPILLWLALNGAIDEWMLDTVLYFKFYKSDASIFQKILNGAGMLNKTQLRGWYFIPVIVICLDIRLMAQKSLNNKPIKLFLYLSALLGFYCSILNGYSWVHAVLILLPVYALFGAYFIEFLCIRICKSPLIARIIPVILLVAAGSEPFITLAKSTPHSLNYFGQEGLQMLRLSNYIQSNSANGGIVVVFSTNGSLGAIIENTAQNFDIGTYAYLSWHKSITDIHFDTYYEELRRNYHFFTRTKNMNSEMDTINQYVEQNYCQVLDTGDFLLYEHNRYLD